MGPLAKLAYNARHGAHGALLAWLEGSSRVHTEYIPA